MTSLGCFLVGSEIFKTESILIRVTPQICCGRPTQGLHRPVHDHAITYTATVQHRLDVLSFLKNGQKVEVNGKEKPSSGFEPGTY